jgi:SAM-dependent methyltransferase
MADDHPSPLFLSSPHWAEALPALRDLKVCLEERGYERTAAVPLPGGVADVTFDPVNLARALSGRRNLFHRSAAWWLYAVALGFVNQAAVDLHRFFFLGRPMAIARVRALLGPTLVRGLVDVGVLEDTGDAVRSSVLVAPFDGRIFLADPFRLQDHPEYCYLGRSTFTVPEFLSGAPSPGRISATPAKATRLLDLACGSGVGAIACANGFAEVVGTDIVERCLRFARLSAALNGVAARFHYSDVFSDVDGSFDVVIANTPCVWADAEPATPRTYASGGSEFGLELPGRMISGALDRLRSGGTVLAVISAPVLHRRLYAVSALERLCADRPVAVVLYPLLEEYELRNMPLYRRHGISTVVRYLAVLRFDTTFSVSVARHDPARLWSYRARTLPARAMARSASIRNRC